jgi:hypothetical protein
LEKGLNSNRRTKRPIDRDRTKYFRNGTITLSCICWIFHTFTV